MGNALTSSCETDNFTNKWQLSKFDDHVRKPYSGKLCSADDLLKMIAKAENHRANLLRHATVKGGKASRARAISKGMQADVTTARIATLRSALALLPKNPTNPLSAVKPFGRGGSAFSWFR